MHKEEITYNKNHFFLFIYTTMDWKKATYGFLCAFNSRKVFFQSNQKLPKQPLNFNLISCAKIFFVAVFDCLWANPILRTKQKTMATSIFCVGGYRDFHTNN